MRNGSSCRLWPDSRKLALLKRTFGILSAMSPSSLVILVKLTQRPHMPSLAFNRRATKKPVQSSWVEVTLAFKKHLRMSTFSRIDCKELFMDLATFSLAFWRNIEYRYRTLSWTWSLHIWAFVVRASKLEWASNKVPLDSTCMWHSHLCEGYKRDPVQADPTHPHSVSEGLLQPNILMPKLQKRVL